MRRFLLALLCLTVPLYAQSPERDAERATAIMAGAEADLVAARDAQNQLAAYAKAVQGYELALSVARGSARQIALARVDAEQRFAAQRDQVAKLLGGLHRVERAPVPLLMIHPSGPAGAVRAGQLMSGLVPILQQEATTLRTEADYLVTLQEDQAAVEALLSDGLAGVRAARASLNDALARRNTARVTVDRLVLEGLRDGSATLQAFARALARQAPPASARFESAEGALPLPAEGRILRAFGTPDAAGIVRPGLILETGAVSLVTAPMDATLRYSGPFLDYDQIAILEPEAGWLLILAGLTEVSRETGEVILAGEPLGTLASGPTTRKDDAFLVENTGQGATVGTNTLYIELRRDGVPIDPAPWFATGMDGE
ncbi:septal ring factor EnvC (AmiA/AmiB activator) [Rubricella aquisinus]|uniref:Septal ring factor EnvC (AmiA/AmiB activator) n=1 Tax=Rubricella aquisinus TaxID=2028108 RepID=A0A840X7V7_9RHOB|nr:peptidase M23 [Rubricella aquisinus]MBB5516797.1 septal ring factor EnvC (AmiA/AmiB activator) [Rubricella aquisinus]